MKLSSVALSMLTLAPPVFGGMVTGKPKSTHLFYKIKNRFDSIQHGLRNLEEESDDCCCCCCDTNDDTNNDDNDSSPNSPSTPTPTTSSMPTSEPTTRLEGINSAMFNIYTALGTTTVDLTGTTYCTWTGVTCDSDNIEPTVINLHYGSLAGYLATDIGMITELTELALDYNDLTGSLPAELNKNENLVVLNLAGNEFTGVIPELSGLSALTELSLADNQLTGALPDLSGLSALTELRAGYNQLTGVIDSSELPTTALIRLNLGGNQLTGVLPDLSGFSAVTFLYLDENQISGSINPSLLPPNLTGFYFNNNLATGSIPDFSGLTALSSLYVIENDLTSSIPDASSFPSTVSSLYLGENDLTGALPDLSSLSLEDLYIRDTLIDASNLPDWLFDIGWGIDVSENQFSGAIPASMGNTNARRVYLSDNQLTATIPDEIEDMTRTTEFSVADNALSGPIPVGVNNLEMDYWMGFFFSVRNNPTMAGTAPTILCAQDYFYYDGTGVICASGS